LAAVSAAAVERTGHAGVAESADASDLSANLSARRETGDAEPLKFGEPCNMAIPSQARTEHSEREGVETRRAAPDNRNKIRDTVKG
jgi:hypothetical protein